MNQIRVLLVDDHQLVRAGFRSLLAELQGIAVVGEACNGREALAQVEALRPDIVIMDITMPDMDGLEATQRITQGFPLVRVLILSMNTSEEFVCQALRAGAVGYLTKTTDPAELEQAIHSVMQGNTFLSKALGLPQLSVPLEPHKLPRSSLERLTPRQREVLKLIAGGLSTKEIAHHLDISAKTVETHRAQLMEALDIFDIPGLVRYAIRMGVISPER